MKKIDKYRTISDWRNSTNNQKQVFHNKDSSEKRKRNQKQGCDIIQTLSAESVNAASLASPKQVSFENRVLELLSKWRDFCPKVFSKLNKLSKKSQVETACSGTNIGTILQFGEKGKICDFEDFLLF